ncbi:MAG: hypothetical protein A3F09_01960 [Chlamydiae bacterium RIFCSPHIGHO2_12_FULL_49_11]|nr:MAG: hypothetical protein A3F09_01960 [Chlamydiae bacterium RIFCSPHIGHO2_12_FULL_49_11]
MFDELSQNPPDPLFGLNAEYAKETRPFRANLSIGVDIDRPNTAPSIFPVVKKVEKEILEEEKTKTFLPIAGMPEFIDLAGKLIFGPQVSDRIVGLQTLGGTGALSMAGEFLAGEITRSICLSSPTWANHSGIFTKTGLELEAYPYWDGQRVPFDRIVDYFRSVKPKTAILLHPCCHNPTGLDFTREEWKALSDLFLKRNLIPFFDFAYHGYGNGLNEDRLPIDLFMEAGHEMFVAYSFAKSMGIYGERAGALFVVMQNTRARERVTNHLSAIARAVYSNPPRHGSEIVARILGNAAHLKEWEEHLRRRREGLNERRRLFGERLVGEVSEKYEYVIRGRGMFSLLDLSPEQVMRLQNEFAVYIPRSSRINIAGLFPENMDHVIKAIKAVHEKK